MEQFYSHCRLKGICYINSRAQKQCRNGGFMRHNKKSSIVCALFIAAVLFVGCGTKEGKAVSLTEDITPYSSRKEDAVLDDTLRIGMNQFSYQLHEKLQDGENIFFSPYSISNALSMLTNGAGGDTKEELSALLGFTDLEKWNQQIQLFLELDKDPNAVLNTANSIWISKNYELAETAKEGFLSPLKNYYQAESFQVDFADHATVKYINEWVSGKTEKMIDPFLKELDNDTKLALINAVYFKGEWKDKFLSELTQDQVFYGSKKETMVKMMNMYMKYYRYLEQDGLQLLQMPYGDSGIVFNLIIPSNESEKEASEQFFSLTNDQKEALFSNLNKEEASAIQHLALPKFQMEYGLIELNKILQELGMVTSFDPIEANFDMIHNDLFISLVAHKAKIEVDEEGSRAAAATIVAMTESAAVSSEKPIDYIVDKPFLFTIQDTKTGIILFMGEVNNLS